MRIGAVVGLKSEARLATRLGFRAAAGGGTEAGTRSAIASLIAGGATALMSFGIAGALAPGLQSGTLILPTLVRDRHGNSWAVDRLWRASLLSASRPPYLVVDEGDLLGAETIAATASEKARLYREIGAVAVDLESHHAAMEAQARGLPLIVVRAIADGPEDTLPSAALLPLRAGGGVDLPAVLASVAARPQQIPALIALARASAHAMKVLRAVGQSVIAG